MPLGNLVSESEIIEADSVVIGAGPGGYVAAIRLGQLGKSVALVENERLGGVCLNVGCIPSKALISASKLVKKARNASKMGIDAEVTVNLAKLQDWKQSVVDRLSNGVGILCRANNVEVMNGTARIVSPNEIELESSDKSRGRTTIKCHNIIVATGSSSIELPNLKFDGKRILTSTEALELKESPKKMLIVGGGVIGLEIGMAYANLFGTELTIVELMDQLLPGLDLELVNVVSSNLQRLGAKIFVKSKVKRAESNSDFVIVVFETSDGKTEKIEVDYVLVSVGRKPNSKGIGLEGVGVELTDRGFVQVDKQMRTNIPNIFAIGDVVGGPLLAHKASKEGIVAAEVIAGIQSSADYVAMPSAIFTDPEIAIVGMNASEAKSQGIEILVGRFPFVASGRALASAQPEGFTKIIADKSTGLILGAEIVGDESTDLISEASLAIEMGATLEDLALTVHPHPTLPETIMEAAEHALGKAIHIQNKPSGR